MPNLLHFIQNNFRKSLLLGFCILFLISCDISSNSKKNYLNDNGTEKFLVTDNKFSDFVVMNSSLTNNRKPFLVNYVVKANIKNNTQNIYKKAYLRGETILVLNNGKELSCNAINYSDLVSPDGVFSKVKSNWKPGEEWFVDELESCNFPIEYFDYPVKEVFTQYYMKVKIK